MSALERAVREGVRDRMLVEIMEKFIDAYDAWAESSELCGGPLFDHMLMARQALELLAPLIVAGGEQGPRKPSDAR